MNMKLFAQRLRECRQSRNFSVKELSELVNINFSTIYRYETGEFKSIKNSVLKELADVLGVDMNYLSGDSNIKYNKENMNELSKKDKKEIDEILNMTSELLNQEGLMFNGTPADKESVQSIIDAMELGLEIAKRKNMQKEKKK